MITLKTLTWMLLFSFSPVLCLSAAAEEWAHIKCQAERLFDYGTEQFKPSDDVYIFRFRDTTVELYHSGKNYWEPQDSEVTREAIEATSLRDPSDQACPGNSTYQRWPFETIINRSTGRFTRTMYRTWECDGSDKHRRLSWRGSCEPADNPQAVRKF